MNQIVINQRPVGYPLRTRLAVVCTRCEREVVRGDCGTRHRAGSAQMMYKRVPANGS